MTLGENSGLGCETMRPAILNPLFAPATALPGVGPRTAPAVERLAGPLAVHLLWHLPSGLIDRRHAPKVAEAEAGTTATLTVRVDHHQPAPDRRRPTRVYCSDETGTLTLVFFHAKGHWLHQKLPEGTVRVVSGRVERYGSEIQMVHPDHIAPLDERDSVQTVEPIYPLTAGVTLKPMTRAVRAALARAPALPEWIEPRLVPARRWPPWNQALEPRMRPRAPPTWRPTPLPARASPMTSCWRTNSHLRSSAAQPEAGAVAPSPATAGSAARLRPPSPSA